MTTGADEAATKAALFDFTLQLRDLFSVSRDCRFQRKVLALQSIEPEVKRVKVPVRLTPEGGHLLS